MKSKLILVLPALLSIASCQKTKRKHTVSTNCTQIEGKYYQDKPIGEWTYRDEKGHLIRDIVYYDSTGNNYEIRYYSKNRVSLIEYFKKDSLLFTSPSYEQTGNGELLYKEYCAGCHIMAQGYGKKSLYSFVMAGNKKGFENSSLNKYHKAIYLKFENANLNKSDIDNIYRYIKDSNATVRN